MTDKYSNFGDLAKTEREDVDFRIICRRQSSDTAIVAPHGGDIEPGTSEIAAAVAADDLSFYSFEGLRPHNNRVLHITSSRFDEPQCIELIKSSKSVITIHGERTQEAVMYLGGRDRVLGDRIREALSAQRFLVKTHNNPNLQGLDPSNICKRGQARAGV